MDAYSIEDMRKELYTTGDYTQAEVEKMSAFEIIQAWTALLAAV